MENFNYEEIKENLKNEEQERKEAEKKNSKALKQISKIEKIEAQLRKEQEKLKEIMLNTENTKTAKKNIFSLISCPNVPCYSYFCIL